MHDNKGYILPLSLIICSIIIINGIYLQFSANLNNQIINTNINKTKSFYNAEDKINIYFNKSKYVEEDLIPRLKHYMICNTLEDYPTGNTVVLDEKDLEPDDNENSMTLNMFKEKGVLKGSIESKSCYNGIVKVVQGIFNVINPMYNVDSAILSSTNVDNEYKEEFNKIFEEFSLNDCSRDVIYIDNYDVVKIILTGKITNKVKIEFYRYNQDEPSKIMYLTKDELFLDARCDNKSKCQVYIEGPSKSKLNGIIFAKGDLTFYSNIIYNGIIVMDGGRLNVCSQGKPSINGLLITNSNEEDSFKDEITINRDSKIINSYGMYLPNYIKPELYLIKEKR